MEAPELLSALMAVARDVGLDVRCVPAAGPEEGLRPSSGVCRVRGRLWIVLCASDPSETRIDVLASALRRHASGRLERCYLPPVVRHRIERSPNPLAPRR
ncbi:MAG: hypothetical protein ACE5FG_13180 [Myxococcota bacterium]